MNSQATKRGKEKESASYMAVPAAVVHDYPLSTTLFVFGVGVGLGFLASHALCDSVARMVQPPPTMTERLGRQLYDVLSQAVPESVARRFAA